MEDEVISVTLHDGKKFVLPATAFNELHKYMPPPDYNDYSKENIRNLIINSKIRSTGPKEINDPTDCRPEFINDLKKKDISKYLSYLKKQTPRSALHAAEINAFCAKYPNRDSIRALKNIPSNFEKMLLDVARSSFDEMGFSCFTEDNYNTLMWSHYAASHRGICVSFRTKPRKRNNSKDLPTIASYLPVKYTNERAKYFASKNISGKSDTDMLRTALYNKSKSWEYEKEYRYYTDIKNMNNIYRTSSMISLGVRPITSVTLGINSSDATKSFVRSCVEQAGYPIQIYRSQFRKGTYNLTRCKI